MANRPTTPPPVTPQDVLDELSDAATILLDKQEKLISGVKTVAENLTKHNGISEAHGFDNPASYIRQTIVSEATRIHNSSGINEAQQSLVIRVTAAEKDIDALEKAVASPTPATAAKAGAVKPDAKTLAIKADGTVSVVTSVAATPGSIVARDGNGKILGDISGNIETATKLKTPRKISVSGAVVGNTTFDGGMDVTLTAALSNLDAGKITTGTLTRPTSGNAATATKLQTPRNISLSGDVTCPGMSFDGTGNITLVSTLTERAQAIGTITGTVTVNLSAGFYIAATVTGSVTIKVSGVPSSGCTTVLFELANGGSSPVTWGMSPKWSNGVAPVLTASGVDLVALSHRAGKWIGVLIGSNVK